MILIVNIILIFLIQNNNFILTYFIYLLFYNKFKKKYKINKSFISLNYII